MGMYSADQFFLTISPETSSQDSRVVLSLQPTPFRVRVEDSVLYARNPLDCLLLPITLGCAIEVESTCPADGSPIQLSISIAGVPSSTPDDCVVALPTPWLTEGYHLHSAGRAQNGSEGMMRFLSSPAAASLWTIAYPDLVILNLQQACDLALDIHGQIER